MMCRRPLIQSGIHLIIVQSFYYLTWCTDTGCSFESSTDPYFYTNTNSLFGMDWSPFSMWGQMISNKVVDDTMYLCLGNGGDASSDPQTGVILFGTSKITIASNSAGGDVVKMTMLDPTAMLLPHPSAYVQLDALNIVSANKATTPLAMSPGPYLIDSGTSYLMLLPDAFTSWDVAFCGSITSAVSDSSMVVTCGSKGDAASNGYTITMSGSSLALPTTTQLNNIFPNISFSFSTASAAVNFKPSVYMNYRAKTANGETSTYVYRVYVEKKAGSSSYGILGNAWMADWLIQQTISTRQLIMTSVKSCSDISY
jgi:hypothetical protein